MKSKRRHLAVQDAAFCRVIRRLSRGERRPVGNGLAVRRLRHGRRCVGRAGRFAAFLVASVAAGCQFACCRWCFHVSPEARRMACVHKYAESRKYACL